MRVFTRIAVISRVLAVFAAFRALRTEDVVRDADEDFVGGFGALGDALASGFVEHEAGAAFGAHCAISRVTEFARIMAHFALLGQQSIRGPVHIRDTCFGRASRLAPLRSDIEPEVVLARYALFRRVRTRFAVCRTCETLAVRDDGFILGTACKALEAEPESQIIPISLYAAGASVRAPVACQTRRRAINTNAVGRVTIRGFRALFDAGVAREEHAHVTLSAFHGGALALKAFISALGADFVQREK